VRDLRLHRARKQDYACGTFVSSEGNRPRTSTLIELTSQSAPCLLTHATRKYARRYVFGPWESPSDSPVCYTVSMFAVYLMLNANAATRERCKCHLIDTHSRVSDCANATAWVARDSSACCSRTRRGCRALSGAYCIFQDLPSQNTRAREPCRRPTDHHQLIVTALAPSNTGQGGLLHLDLCDEQSASLLPHGRRETRAQSTRSVSLRRMRLRLSSSRPQSPIPQLNAYFFSGLDPLHDQVRSHVI